MHNHKSKGMSYSERKKLKIKAVSGVTYGKIQKIALHILELLLSVHPKPLSMAVGLVVFVCSEIHECI